jgi:PAS domain S-box-containing protein
MDFRPVFFHGAVEEITGYTADEFIAGKPRWDQIIHPEDLPNVFTEDEKKLHSIPNYSYGREYRILRKDGQIRWVHEAIGNVSDDSGKPIMVQGVIHDITERKQADKALRERKEILQTILDNIPVMIAFMDSDGRHQWVNQAWEKTLGWSLSEAQSRDILKELYPDPEYYRYVVDFIKRAKSKWGDFRTRRREGTVLDTIWTNIPLSDGSNIGIGIDITERKRAEEALRESTEKFNTFMEQLPVTVFIKDENSRMLYVNPYMAREFGADKWIGRTAKDYYPADVAEGVLAHDKRVLSEGPSTQEEWVPDKDGRIRCMSVTKFLIQREGKTPLIGGMAIDITEHKRVEEALQESELKYRSLFENMLSGFAYCKIILDENKQPVDFVYLDVNDAFEKLTGLKKENVLGKKVTEAIPGIKELHPELFEIYGKVALTGKEARFDILFKPLEIWLSISVYSPQEGYFVALFENITERKRAEVLLCESEERLQAALSAAELGTWDWDLVTGKITWSGHHAKLFGFSEGEFDGRYETFEKRIHPEDRKGLKEAVERALCERSEYSHEYRVVWPDGTIRWIAGRGRYHWNEKGEAVRMFGAVHDITEHKRAEEEIEKLARFPSENPNPVLRISDGGVVLYSNEASKPLLEAWQCGAGQRLPEYWHEFVLASLNRRQVQEAEVECGSRIYSLKFAPVIRGNYVNVYGLDITERKETEAKLLDYQRWLKSLASELSLAEEHERRRLAKGVHDQIGQKLALTKLTLRSLMESISESNVLASLGAISDELDDVIEETHLLTFELSNPILYELGLERAVEKWLAEQIEGKHGIKCKFVSQEKPLKLDEQSRGILFQDIQELLANVVRHAKAKTVEVCIEQAGEMVQVTVRDDGVGFDPSGIYTSMREGKTGGFGLFGIRERLEYLGGSMRIESAPGQGSSIVLALPLKRKGN